MYVFVNAVNIFQNDLESQKVLIPLIIKQIPNFSEEL